MSTRPEHRRDVKKMSTLQEVQQRRREQALQRQSNARREHQQRARELALQRDKERTADSAEAEGTPVVPGPFGSTGILPAVVHAPVATTSAASSAVEDGMEEDNDMQDGSDTRMASGRERGAKRGDGALSTLSASQISRGHQRSFYSKQLQVPEWMIDVPPRLREEWYVVVHPEGERCLVISSRGGTVSYRRSGRILHRFPSALPNGSRATGESQDVYCILDAVFHEADQTYYVVDLMCWRGHSVYDCTPEFRFFWVQCKLAETQAMSPPHALHRFRFWPLAAGECTPENLRAAYMEPTPFIKGGLLFYNKAANYSPGLTPLMLHWKDTNCSRYVVDTDKDGNVLPHQLVVLRLRADGAVVTEDDPPVPIAILPAPFIQSMGEKLRPGLLLRFAVADRGLQVVEGVPMVAGIVFDGVANQRRAYADSYTKVLFQYAARTTPLTFQQIYAAIAAPADPAAPAAMADPPTATHLVSQAPAVAFDNTSPDMDE